VRGEATRLLFLLTAFLSLGTIGLGQSTAACRPGDSDIVEIQVGETRRVLSLKLPSIALGRLSTTTLSSALSLTIDLEQRIRILHRCICSDGPTSCPAFMSTSLMASVPVEIRGTADSPIALPDEYEAPGLARMAHVVLASGESPVFLEGVPDELSCTGMQVAEGTVARGELNPALGISLSGLGVSVQASSVAFEPVLACCCSGSLCSSGPNHPPRISGLPRRLFFDSEGRGRCSFAVWDEDGPDDISGVHAVITDAGMLPLGLGSPVEVRESHRADRVEGSVVVELDRELAEAYIDRGPLFLSLYASD
jgi:hypothetical protein